MEQTYKIRNIKVSELVLNDGQIEGLPKNPRFIRDERFEHLKKSIEDAPEMLDYRRLAVYPHKGKYVVLCGNMRLRACRELGYKEMPCYVLNAELEAKKLREYVIKDNESFGQNDWDVLANEWDNEELKDWGMEVWSDTSNTTDIDSFFEENSSTTSSSNEFKIEVKCPNELTEQREDIITAVKEALQAYTGIKIK